MNNQHNKVIQPLAKELFGWRPYLLLLMLLLCCFKADARECKKVLIAGVGDWFPLLYQAPQSKEIKGIAYDAIREIADELKVEIHFRHGIPFKHIISNLDKGKIDACAALFKNSQRAKKYQYLPKFTTLKLHLVVRKGEEFSLETWEPLKNKIGGKHTGAWVGEKFAAYAAQNKLEIEEASSSEKLMLKLIHGHNDYVPFDQFNYHYYVKKLNIEDKVSMLPEVLESFDIHMAFSSNSPCSYLAPAFSSELKRMKKDGRMEAIVQKYTQ